MRQVHCIAEGTHKAHQQDYFQGNTEGSGKVSEIGESVWATRKIML